MAGEIVLGYDGSEGARVALDEAGRLATAFGTGVVLVFGYAAIPAGGETQDLEIEVRKLGQAATDEAAALLADRGVPSTIELVHDRPEAAIVAVSEQQDARYIVVGATGVGPLRGAVLGSITYELVHRSTRPVVVVPPKA